MPEVDWNSLVTEKLVRPGGGQSQPGHESWGAKPAVSFSGELRRVLGLPRRDLELDGTERAETIIDMMMERFARPVVPGRRCRCAELDPDRHREEGCIERFRLPQAQALREIGICGGLLGPIGVGHGKTLVDLLAALAFREYDKAIKDIVLLVPAGLAEQLEGDYVYYGQHFKMPQIVFHGGIDYSNTLNKMDTRVPLERGCPTIHVVKYTTLSRPESTVWLEQHLKPQAIIADECFPATTVVLTDEGPLPIGDIVDQGRGSLALSYNTESRAYVWRRILSRLRRPGGKPLVRVDHEFGHLICTADHKIWTSAERYVRAVDLHAGQELVRAPLREMRAGVQDTEARGVDGALLLEVVRREPCVEREEIPCAVSSEDHTPDWRRGSVAGAAQDLGGETPRPDVPRARRKRAADETAATSSCGPRAARGSDGACDSDATSTRALSKSAGQLQGRYRDPGREASDRGRRPITQDEKMEVSRSPQDRDPQLSRVVSVEILERGDADGDRSYRGGNPVYDLTVEGEHNYFADGILVSNCHKLRSAGLPKNKGATGARAWRYMEEIAPNTLFVGLSGSMTAKKIQDYWHLAKWALRGGSPLPTIGVLVDEWGGAINPSENPADPGRLMELCREGEHLSAGFKRRIAETIGVVTTAAPSVDVALTLNERAAPSIPPDVATHLRNLRNDAVRPDGEELLTSLEVAACAMQLSFGFYLRWIYPKCEFPRDEQLVLDWKATRRAYFKEVRTMLKEPEEHLDSPRLVMNAAERFYGMRPQKKGLPTWESRAFPEWNKMRGRVYVETEAICFNDFIVQDAAAWAHEHRGVVWYEHDAMGEWLAQISGLPKYGGGKAAKEAMLGSAKNGTRGEDGTRSIIASVKAHGTGTNGMQHRWHKCLLLHITPDPNLVEQTLGREHRPGQNNDCEAWFYRHTEEMKAQLDDALDAAGYVEGTGFGQQKILRAWGG